jgi:hypothetical protein
MRRHGDWATGSGEALALGDGRQPTTALPLTLRSEYSFVASFIAEGRHVVVATAGLTELVSGVHDTGVNEKRWVHSGEEASGRRQAEWTSGG